VNDNDRAEWVNNDERLYLWWKREGGSLRNFVRRNRAALTLHINETLNRKPRST
jgi:hypothetical protein